MKFFILIFAVLFVGVSVSAQDLMQGTETAAFAKASETARCLGFGQYVVKTVSGEGVGEDIEVFRRGTSAANAACQTPGKSYFAIKNPDANYFIGIFGVFLFVDSGTSVESRGLEIFDLNRRKSVFVTEYADTAKIEQKRFVIYEKPSTQKGNLRSCKDAAKWKREGLSVAWVQPKRLDLETLKETNGGALRCIAQQ